MASPFTFGDVILQVLQNQDQKQLQIQQMANEQSYRQESLKQAQQQIDLARGAESERQREFNAQQARLDRDNPIVDLPGMLRAAGLEVNIGDQTKAGVVIPGDTIASRMNNPLNLQYSHWLRKYNALPGEANSEGQYAQFPSPEVGIQAAKEQLLRPIYRDLSVNDALLQWSREKSGKSGYGGELVPDLKDKTMKDLSPEELSRVVDAMALRESGTKSYTRSDIATAVGSLPERVPLSAANTIIDNLNKTFQIKSDLEAAKGKQTVAQYIAELKQKENLAVEANKRSLQDLVDASGSPLQSALGTLPTQKGGVMNQSLPVLHGLSLGDLWSIAESSDSGLKKQQQIALETARPGLSKNLNTLGSIISHVLSSPTGRIEENQYGALRAIAEDLNYLSTRNDINFNAPYASKGTVTTVGKVVASAQSLLSGLLNSTFASESARAQLKADAQQGAILERQLKLEQAQQGN